MLTLHPQIKKGKQFGGWLIFNADASQKTALATNLEYGIFADHVSTPYTIHKPHTYLYVLCACIMTHGNIMGTPVWHVRLLL